MKRVDKGTGVLNSPDIDVVGTADQLADNALGVFLAVLNEQHI
ncbi:MAG: hypothetical protein R3D01_13840 [Hyphomicrobiales bacterium]